MSEHYSEIPELSDYELEACHAALQAQIKAHKANMTPLLTADVARQIGHEPAPYSIIDDNTL